MTLSRMNTRLGIAVLVALLPLAAFAGDIPKSPDGIWAPYVQGDVIARIHNGGQFARVHDAMESQQEL